MVGRRDGPARIPIETEASARFPVLWSLTLRAESRNDLLESVCLISAACGTRYQRSVLLSKVDRLSAKDKTLARIRLHISTRTMHHRR